MNDHGDDDALVARFLAGRDEGSFRALYRRHSPFLYRFLARWSGSAAAAEEGVQETWIRAVRGLSGFERRSSLKTWLAGIAIRWWREEERRRVRQGPSAEDEPPAPEDPTLADERLDLERAIAALPAGYRETLLLHDVEGYTHEETARLLGVDPGTSKSQLSRARRALRGLLTGGDHGRARRTDR
ncbi:MAG TPA: RNA polymerase sigma factor [Thermoanaerobaculia bacterium]|nr:RNA polymerase sigma factor [Thermoanaerobaculia bacterium]